MPSRAAPNGRKRGAMVEHPQEKALRASAERCRQRAARSPHGIAHHLWIAAAEWYERAAAKALRGEQAEARAVKYDKDPGDTD